MVEKTDCIVIGAGVIGLAVAMTLARQGREVVIIEAESAIGTHTSSRNTGCIHAGINYVPGSLKARLVLRGKELLYRFCEEHGVGHHRCGKMLVATDPDEVSVLHAVIAKAAAIGPDDLRILSSAEAREMEPRLRFEAVVYSPSSGIVDAHDLMLALLGEAEEHGGALALGASVEGGRALPEGVEITVGGSEKTVIRCNLCVNAAGLGAQKVASGIKGVAANSIPDQVLAKGCYFIVRGTPPFSRLIYPLPSVHGRAMHVSPDISGQIRLGPDTAIVDRIDYTVEETRAPAFYDAARLFWSEIREGDLVPGYAGVRPKLNRNHATANDFVIQGPDVHGVPGLINLYGIESPGLTSSLAIGEHVAVLAGVT